jgi:hypothetical protein
MPGNTDTRDEASRVWKEELATVNRRHCLTLPYLQIVLGSGMIPRHVSLLKCSHRQTEGAIGDVLIPESVFIRSHLEVEPTSNRLRQCKAQTCAEELGPGILNAVDSENGTLDCKLVLTYCLGRSLDFIFTVWTPLHHHSTKIP